MAAPVPAGPMLATYDSVAAVGYKVADARADLLVGQGNILKNAGDNTSAILRDANNNSAFTNANIDRSAVAGMQETVRNAERLATKADTIAWNEMGLQEAGFSAARSQNEHINEAQTAQFDRSAKFNSTMLSDSFARLSAQGENGFARQLQMTTDAFANSSAAAAANYANLSAQNFSTKETVAGYGNRAADQTATVLATLSGQHADQTRDFLSATRDLASQAAANAAAVQLEAAKNAAAAQLQAAVNSKESVLQASFLAKDALLENSKWFALAEKTAMVNKLDTDAKLAACCCEIKETVIGTANATQSLLQSTEAARVRDALSAAVAENSILRLRREERGPYPVPYPFPFRGESPRREREERR